ncbi:hypothetical protein LAM67_27235, partial [Mycobacterium tuberculosis]|nr:hypothetical protein [Mycobacterium tuberculosis]
MALPILPQPIKPIFLSITIPLCFFRYDLISLPSWRFPGGEKQVTLASLIAGNRSWHGHLGGCGRVSERD